MAVFKRRSKRKPSGGRYHAARKRKARDVGRDALYTRVSKASKTRAHRRRGGASIRNLLTTTFASVSDGKKAQKAAITEVVENAASRHFVRQKVITRGAIIKTEAGLARVTSRPTRDGTVNAVLLKKA